MAKWNKPIITTVGTLLLQSTLKNKGIEISKIKCSSKSYSDVSNINNLDDIKDTFLPSSVNIENDKLHISSILTNERIEVGYNLETIGIYAKTSDSQEVLFAVITASESDFIPSNNLNTFMNINFDFYIALSTSANFVINYNTNALLRNSDLDIIINEKTKNKADKTNVINDLEINEDNIRVNKNGNITNLKLPIVDKKTVLSWIPEAGDNVKGLISNEDVKSLIPTISDATEDVKGIISIQEINNIINSKNINIEDATHDRVLNFITGNEYLETDYFDYLKNTYSLQSNNINDIVRLDGLKVVNNSEILDVCLKNQRLVSELINRNELISNVINNNDKLDKLLKNRNALYKIFINNDSSVLFFNNDRAVEYCFQNEIISKDIFNIDVATKSVFSILLAENKFKKYIKASPEFRKIISTSEIAMSEIEKKAVKWTETWKEKDGNWIFIETPYWNKISNGYYGHLKDQNGIDVDGMDNDSDVPRKQKWNYFKETANYVTHIKNENSGWMLLYNLD